MANEILEDYPVNYKKLTGFNYGIFGANIGTIRFQSLLHYQTPGFCKESFAFEFFLAGFLKNQDLQYNENRI
ncbi:hypothetical protein QMM42_03185 [Leptospira santarosai]|uniref:hypothetical protein n=1 Tax=Leptospira santarosai TaxID=28183 RepID=UPI00024894E4|nr:hypothetical protein [Leptospira santarosai]EMM75602.1 hypothetical protein LEP1GSC040_3320 [Leptospira santarosai str. 2000030832]MDI7185222.1 hypothetical protein [Leptospira santarosai]MDI7196093.1 hypothetical protein [Leptospira santarosai]MDI7199263.1 hypothetical protein [Leptospira santarosai]MDI7205782.1 hypothetical protein [Leptospira santarosai]